MTNAVDLSKLPAPDVIQNIKYEDILNELKASFRKEFSEDYRFLESDPATKLLEVFAYRELALRQHINSASRANMLAYAQGSDLDNLAALFNVKRVILVEADPTAIPPVEAVYEDDERFLRRISLAMESFSTAGPAGAYQYHTYQADSGIKDVYVDSPEAGEVRVVPLSDKPDKNGLPSLEQLKRINQILKHEDVRPLTDKVVIRPPRILPFKVEAKITTEQGPGNEWSSQQALQKLQQYIDAQTRLGARISRSAIIASLHQPGVSDIELTHPIQNIEAEPTQCPILSTETARAPEYPIITNDELDPYAQESRKPYRQGKLNITLKDGDYVLTTLDLEAQL